MPTQWALILPPGDTATTYHLADCGIPIVVASHILTNLAEAAQALERAGMQVALVDLLRSSALPHTADVHDTLEVPAPAALLEPDVPGAPIDAALLCICGMGFTTAARLEEHKSSCGVYSRGGPRIQEFPGEGG